ncbi:MAG: Crp/Fnr family transcriptional regulator [Pyrinomonadaceae bacterium]
MRPEYFAKGTYSDKKKMASENFSYRTARENGIFNSLPAGDYERIRPHLEDVCLPVGQNLYEYGDAIQYVYFPLDAVIHLFLTMKSGATIEAGIVSSEGVLGFAVFMGAKTLSSQAVVLHSSRALRIKAEIIKQEFDKGGHFQNLILRYINAFYIQLSQTAACNHIHHLEGRLCRWLLLLHDRLKTNHLKVTQDFIAQMLGTRRPYVTAAVGSLQRKGIIRCTRGHIEILDRKSLENCCCECYEIIRRESDFPKKIQSHPADNHIPQNYPQTSFATNLIQSQTLAARQSKHPIRQ